AGVSASGRAGRSDRHRGARRRHRPARAVRRAARRVWLDRPVDCDVSRQRARGAKRAHDRRPRRAAARDPRAAAAAVDRSFVVEREMRNRALVLLLLMSVPALAQQGALEIPFESVPDFLQLPDGMNFGEVPGVAVNAQGHVFVFTRSNSASGPAYAPTAAQLLEFGAKGEFIREVGKGLYGWSFAHSVRIDKDDNIWAIDKGSDMVIKFNQAGQVMWVFGRRKESADHETAAWENVDPPLPHVDGLFRQPTDVAWDSQGNIYISDGYINSRVAKYDRNGDWVKSWGEKGTGPG